MHFRLQLIAVADDGTEATQEISTLTRGAATLDTLGLTLAESKHLLGQVQQRMVGAQVNAYLAAQRACPACGKNRPLKERPGPLPHALRAGRGEQSPLAAV